MSNFLSSNYPQPKIVVIGIGNPLMADDGVGPYVVSLLRERGVNAGLIELDTPGYSLLTYISDCQTVIIVDAADFGGRVGEIRQTPKAGIRSGKSSSRLDSHSIDLVAVLDYAQTLQMLPPTVWLYCIQVRDVYPHFGLSNQVAQAAQYAARLIELQLQENL